MNQHVTRKACPLQWFMRGVVALALLSALTFSELSYAQSQPTVQLADSALGDVLVGPNGMTLYTFANDQPGSSNCTGGCALNWPPLTLMGELVAPPGLPGDLGTLVRQPDEETGERVTQVTYNGQPLYYWSRDEVPGQTSGQGIGSLWFVAKP